MLLFGLISDDSDDDTNHIWILLRGSFAVNPGPDRDRHATGQNNGTGLLYKLSKDGGKTGSVQGRKSRGKWFVKRGIRGGRTAVQSRGIPSRVQGDRVRSTEQVWPAKKKQQNNS